MNFSCSPRIILAVTALTLSSAYSQDSTGGTLTLARALALTLERSPELASSSWDVRAAEAQIIQARLIPNPNLSLSAEDVTGTGDYARGNNAEHTLQLSQLVQLGGKRAARTTQAELSRTLAHFDYQVKRVAVLRNTTQAFVDVLVAQRRLALAEETVRLWGNAVPLTQKRFEKGAAPEVELTRASVAVEVAQISLEQSRRDLLAASSINCACMERVSMMRSVKVRSHACGPCS